MQQQPIKINLLYSFINGCILAKRYNLTLEDVALLKENTRIDDPGYQFREHNMVETQLNAVFLSTMIGYILHRMTMNAIAGDLPEDTENIFAPYAKKGRKFTMYDCIDIMQHHMAKDLVKEREKLNPLGDAAYL